jgi:hypothetical protein
VLVSRRGAQVATSWHQNARPLRKQPHLLPACDAACTHICTRAYARCINTLARHSLLGSIVCLLRLLFYYVCYFACVKEAEPA